MQKAREIAKQAPAVQSAEAKLKSATSPEERQKASKVKSRSKLSPA